MELLTRIILSPTFFIVAIYVGCVLYVHRRGKVRLRLGRQFTEHSGLFSPYNVPMYLFSDVPKDPYLDARTFPELQVLKDNWETIRDEAQALHEAGQIDYRKEHNDLAFVAFKKRGWKRFYLKWYEDFMPSAVEHCPKTVELVRSIPSINAAAFTMLPPGKQLGRHRDPFAGSLRYHLGLVTPKSDGCKLWVDGEAKNWREGEDFVFDETYVHWAENATDENRIIFFADVTRPLKTRFMRAFSNFMNHRVFKITRSNNTSGEKAGALNAFTPIVYRIKYFFTGLKEKNRTLYYGVKRTLMLAAGYLILVRPLLNG